MDDFLHIHLPCNDDDIKALEEVLGIKFRAIVPEMIPSEKVEVCPLPDPIYEIPKY